MRRAQSDLYSYSQLFRELTTQPEIQAAQRLDPVPDIRDLLFAPQVRPFIQDKSNMASATSSILQRGHFQRD